MPKIHEIWPSSNRFLCGCCIAGPGKDWMGSACIHCCSLCVLVPFCVFVAGSNLSSAPVLPILLFLSVISMFVFLYLTACTDPGIIPRRAFLDRHPGQYQRFLTSTQTNMRVCQTCNIIRPTKASHCSACKNCVQIFDHHCGIIGTCIAKRNYRYFILFLGSVVLSIALLLINMVVFLMTKSESTISQTAVIVIAAVVAAILGLPLIGFFIFHLYLAITRNTTRELLKNIKHAEGEEVENQWCQVDPPNVDFYQEISQEQADSILERLQHMAPLIVPDNNTTTPAAQPAILKPSDSPEPNPVNTSEMPLAG